jgi:hypothetical protein
VQEAGQLGYSRVNQATACGVDHKHARRIAFREGMLRDQFLGKLVVEVSCLHDVQDSS